ncbi:hypothetical protein M0804_014978 [Polistes exclamans]|nr:hypothetical protein M0804_014978 [Polistes exclamans]
MIKGVDTRHFVLYLPLPLLPNCNKLTAANIAVKQAKNDADVFIIETAIEKFDATNTTIVVGEDVDLLVLLTARTPMDEIIYFLKPGRAQ